MVGSLEQGDGEHHGDSRQGEVGEALELAELGSWHGGPPAGRGGQRAHNTAYGTT